MTRYQKALLNIVNNSYDHPTVEELRIKMEEAGYHPSRATVYNNVSALSDEGFIKKLNIGSVTRYDKIQKHDHLVCQGCGKIKDIPQFDIMNLTNGEDSEYITDHDLTLYYLCPECRSKINACSGN